MEKVTGVLLKMLGKSKVQEDRFHLEQLRQTWPDLVGKALARHTFPDRLNRKKLFILADNSAWSAELLIHKEMLLQTFNEVLGGETLKELHFLVGKYPRPKKDKKLNSVMVRPPLTKEEEEAALASCPVLKDEKLAARARKFFLNQASLKKALHENGSKFCPRCGALMEKEERFCSACLLEKQAEIRVQIAQLLKKEPWLSEEDVCLRLECEDFLYRSVKESLKAFYNLKVRQETATKEDEKLAVYLTSGKKPELISDAMYVNILEFLRGKKKNVFTNGK